MAKTAPDYRAIGKQMVLLGSYEDFDLDQIFEVLKASDVAYHEDADPFIDDADYDALRKYALASEPHNPYFTGVGSNVRGGKIPLPYSMGSLDQIEVGQIGKWVESNDLNDEELPATDKLDGVSAMIVYNDTGGLQIGYSRGDGVQGADITRHVRHFVPNQINNGGESFVIRGEIIISKANFPIVQSKFRTSGGEAYKNARNMVAGCMNASERDKELYKYIDFVAYQIVSPADALNYWQSLKLLGELGFNVVETPAIFRGDELLFGDDRGKSGDECLAEILAERRESGPYEIDGLVLCVDSLIKRERLVKRTRDSLNPSFAIKYKVQDASNLAVARVVEVQWNTSKHGYLKPRVVIEPVKLVGVTIQHATGFNAKFIKDNGIGPGAEVQITRSGDVIPFIQEVITPTTPMMPSEEWEWNETGVDAVLSGESTNEQIIGQMVSFFDSIDAPLLKEGNVSKLLAAGFDIAQIIQADAPTLVNVLGSNGSKVHAGLRAKLTNIPLYRLLGAFSSERGLGVRKTKKLQQALGHDHVLDLATDDLDRITAIEGFEYKTAQKVARAVHEFHIFMQEIDGHYSFDKSGGFSTSGSSMSGEKVVFTGFRDKLLQAEVESAGGTMQSSVSGKTTILVCSNPNSNSGKAKKARDLGVRVIGVDELKDMLA